MTHLAARPHLDDPPARNPGRRHSLPRMSPPSRGGVVMCPCGGELTDWCFDCGDWACDDCGCLVDHRDEEAS